MLAEISFSVVQIPFSYSEIPTPICPFFSGSAHRGPPPGPFLQLAKTTRTTAPHAVPQYRHPFVCTGFYTIFKLRLYIKFKLRQVFHIYISELH